MARILLIEDDELLAEIMVDHLAAAGHMVNAVHDGRDAVRAIDNSGPDILVLDHDLPGVSGLEILREVRDSAHGARLPILMLTAQNGPLLPARAHHAGVDAYLVKPVTPDRLLQRIEELLRSAALANRVARAAR